MMLHRFRLTRANLVFIACGFLLVSSTPVEGASTTSIASFTGCQSSEQVSPKNYPGYKGLICRYLNPVSCTVQLTVAGKTPPAPYAPYGAQIAGVRCPAIFIPKQNIWVCPPLLACANYQTP